MALNVGKMRRHMARTTPDAVWRDFDKETFMEVGYYSTHSEYDAWVKHWVEMMKIKHSGKPVVMDIFQSKELDTNKIRIQLVVGGANVV